MTRHFLVSLLAASALTACAAGPEYNPPSTPPAAAGAFLGSDHGSVSTAGVEERWWSLYNDPLLDGLVNDALTANTDIRVAVARIERARASLRGARSERLPQTALSASESYNRTSEVQSLPGVDRENWMFDAALDMSYEVDLFGRVRRGVEAARGDLAAQQADADGVRIAVIADTVRAYLDVTATAERLAVAKRTVDLLSQSVRITTARFDAGRSDRLDIVRVTALLEQQRATLPSLRADRDAALFRLATLTGRTPQEIPESVRSAIRTPQLSQPIPIGDGQSLLARRPDVRAAERRLAADTARIGVATADLYPRIRLGGSIGTTAVGGGNLFGGGPLNWLFGPLISWAFPNQEAIRARIGAARADSAASLAAFDGAVLRALEETETALSVYANAIERVRILENARLEAERAARISLARQREGRIDFLTVLDAQRTLAGAEAEKAAAVRALSFAQVNLFRALGGGWGSAATGVASSAGH